MGGTALGVQSSRLERVEYELLFEFLKDVLPALRLIPSYFTKSSFGDADVLYPVSSGYTTEMIRETLKVNGFKLYENDNKNGRVYSLGVVWKAEIFQVDFIRVEDEVIDFAFNYFAYNDLGNLLGRVARNLNLKLGFEGLFYSQRSLHNDDIILKEHRLTTDFNEALTHLGYDHTRFGHGFETLEDIFEFVMSSRFYNFDKFDLTQRNRKARVRDEKRPNYRAFLQYANEHPKEAVKIDRIKSLYYTFDRWPDVEEEYYKLQAEDKIFNEYKLVYNGNVVSRLTGLEGKELGMCMAKLNTVFGKHNMVTVISFAESGELDNFILRVYNSFILEE